MKEKIILIGGGGHCKSCIDGNTLEEDSCIDQPNNPINQTDDDRKTDNKRPDPQFLINKFTPTSQEAGVSSE